MNTKPCLLGRLLLCIYVLLITACASVANTKGQPQAVFENFVQGSKVLVLPVYSILNDFKPYSPALFEAIAQNLEANSFNVFELTDKEFASVRQQALQAVGAVYSPDLKELIAEDPRAYVNALIASLIDYGDFDIMLVPELHVRHAQLNGSRLMWDSVTETLIVQNGRISDWKNKPDTHRALSLRIYHFSKQAGQVIKRDIGLSIPYEVVLDKKHEGHYQTPRYLISEDQINRALNILVQPLRQDLEN